MLLLLESIQLNRVESSLNVFIFIECCDRVIISPYGSTPSTSLPLKHFEAFFGEFFVVKGEFFKSKPVYKNGNNKYLYFMPYKKKNAIDEDYIRSGYWMVNRNAIINNNEVFVETWFINDENSLNTIIFHLDIKSERKLKKFNKIKL